MGNSPSVEIVVDSKEKAMRRSRSPADRKAKEMAIIVEIGRLISSTLNIDEVYERFAAEVRKLISFDRINVNLKSPDGETFYIAYISGIDLPGRRRGEKIPLAGTITETIFRTRAGLLLHPVNEREILSHFPRFSSTSSNTFRAGMRSMMAVPLISRNEAIGALHFRAKKPNVYTEQDLILAERIGRQIAGAIANATLFADLDRLANEMATIVEIGRLISSTLNIGEVYEGFAAEVRKLIPFDRINVNLKNPDGETFTIAYVSGLDLPGRRQGDKIPLAGTITEELFRTRTGLFLHPESEEQAFGTIPHASTASSITFRAGMRSMMAVPLISRNEVIGVLHYRAIKPNLYNERDLLLAERIGRQIAGAIANSRLFKELRETEASLRESEVRFRAIFEQAAVGAAEMDVETGRFLTVNQRLCEIVGRTEEELLATTFVAITHPDDLRLHLEGMTLLTAGKLRNFTLEKRYIKKDGETVWMSISISPLWKPGEPLSSNIVVIQDITERKQAEDEKHRSQRITERLAKEMAIIAEIGRVIGSTLNIWEVYDRFAQEVQNLIPFDRLSVVTNINPTEGTYKMAYINGMDIPERKPGAVVPLANSFCEIVMETRKGIVTNFKDIDDMRRRFPTVSRNLAIKLGLISMISVPLISRDEVSGMLHIRSSKPNAYTEEDLRLAGRIGEQIAGAIVNAQLYDELKITHDELESRVQERTIELKETNTALRVLLKKGDKDQKTLEENLQSNVNQLVTPFLSRLRLSQSNAEGLIYLNILEENLNHIVSPFVNRLSTAYRNLTPKEIQIAELVKQGKRSKEIAELFGVSVGTVITHRNNIRKKLQLKSRDANLRSHLLSLS